MAPVDRGSSQFFCRIARSFSENKVKSTQTRELVNYLQVVRKEPAVPACPLQVPISCLGILFFSMLLGNSALVVETRPVAF